MKDDKPIIGKWRNRKNYQCRLCAFSTLEEAVFIDHFARVHPPLRIMRGGKKEAEGKDVSDMTRPELNDHAAKAGVESPESYGNKADLIAAIEAAEKKQEA